MSIFPFITPITDDNNSSSLDTFKEYAYDFENNCLKIENGLTYLVEKNEALKIWIYKTLYTERFRYIAYTHAYGNEVHTLIGQNIQSDITYSEIKRFIVEAIMVNPYIKELTNFQFSQTGSCVNIAFYVTTIYGDMTYTMDWKEV